MLYDKKIEEKAYEDSGLSLDTKYCYKMGLYLSEKETVYLGQSEK